MKKSLEQAREKQDYLFNEMANLMGALASPVRLKIFHFLTQAPHSVEHLADKLGQTVANTSMHLKKLERENLLKIESRAQKRIYSLAQSQMKDFWEQVLQFSLIHDPRNTLSSQDLYGENLDWEKSLEETAKLIRAKKVALLDVRPLDETDPEDILYRKNVLNIPYDEMKKRKEALPQDKPLLVICRGRLCVMSQEVTYHLRKTGINAYRLGHSWHQLSKILAEV